MVRRLYQRGLAVLTVAGLSLMSQAAVASASPAASPRTILAFGDSLTAGYQLRPGESFPAQLEAALRSRGRAVTVHNAGVSGDTTTQGRARLNWVLAGMKTSPDLVIVELGANDMLRGAAPAVARANLDAMLAELARRKLPVILAGMQASPNLGAAYAKDFNAIYPALAKAHGTALYPFFLDGVAGVPGLQLGDGMHPTGKGVALIVKRIMPLVERTLDRPLPAPSK